MTSFKITAKAPTAYQYTALTRFGMPIKAIGNGSFFASKEFDTEADAKAFLSERAKYYYDEYEGQPDYYLTEIDQCGTLYIDSVTAVISVVED